MRKIFDRTISVSGSFPVCEWKGKWLKWIKNMYLYLMASTTQNFPNTMKNMEKNAPETCERRKRLNVEKWKIFQMCNTLIMSSFFLSQLVSLYFQTYFLHQIHCICHDFQFNIYAQPNGVVAISPSPSLHR